eukprot:364078-Chlamydomonas_euryale.AAC.7
MFTHSGVVCVSNRSASGPRVTERAGGLVHVQQCRCSYGRHSLRATQCKFSYGRPALQNRVTLNRGFGRVVPTFQRPRVQSEDEGDLVVLTTHWMMLTMPRSRPTRATIDHAGRRTSVVVPTKHRFLHPQRTVGQS